jgi:hypothetical protein
MTYRIVDSKEETIRGFIYQDDRLVCKTFPYSDEYTVDTSENIAKVQEKLSSGSWVFYPSYEGTILRIVNDGDTQLIATHKKLDAFNSRWGCDQSFGELFKTSITEFNKDSTLETPYENFLSLLKDDYHHTFLLCSNLDSRIVANRDNEIFYVGSFDSKTHKYLGILPCIKEKISVFCNSINQVEISHNDMDKIVDYVENKVEPFSQQGLVAIRQDDFSVFKIMNSTYKHLSELRGNNPSLSSRYLELLLKRKDLVLDFCTIFGNKHHEFGYISELLDDTLWYLYNVITTRYVKKRFMNVTPLLHSFVKQFEKVDNPDDLTFEKVCEKMSEKNTSYVWSLMQAYMETCI